MMIGHLVEGATDAAFLAGLQRRGWCRGATLQRLHAHAAVRKQRHYLDALKEARVRKCDLVVILRDSDNARPNTVYQQIRGFIGSENEHFVVIGVVERNIECWICADPDYMASCCTSSAADFRLPDPKAAFQKAFGVTGYDRREKEISELVHHYPSLSPMLGKRSFRRFYDDVRGFAQRNGCQIPNELNN